MNKPFFSVIMPAYNREKYIEQAIASVLDQGFSDFELIVVDDGSEDGTGSSVKRFNDRRLRLLRCKHKGGAAARNAGLLVARGEFVVWVDSDDIQAPDALLSIYKASIANPDSDVFYGDLLAFNVQPSVDGYLIRYPEYEGVDLLPILIRGNCLPNPGTAVRRELYKVYGGYNEEFIRCHDYHMWTKLAGLATFKKIDSVLCYWRQHGESLSSTKSKEFEGRVVLDMFSKYPVGKLFPDLLGGEADKSEGAWRLTCILQEMQEFTSAIRMACEAIRLGKNAGSQLDDLAVQGVRAGQPFFSIILTTYNRADLLFYSLQSLAAQEFQGFEVILINDCGECVAHLLADYEFPITYIRQGVNQGLSAARNVGLKLARGSYICYLDDDDVYLPNHLSVLASEFSLAPLSVVYTEAEYVNERIENGKRVELSRNHPFAHDKFDKERLFVQNYIPVNVWSHPRCVLPEVGEFDVTLSAFEDWDMLMRLAAKYPVIHSSKITAEVHLRDAPNTGSDHMLGREQKNFGSLYREMYRRHSDLGSDRVKASRANILSHYGLAEASRNTADLSSWLSKRDASKESVKLLGGALSGGVNSTQCGIVILNFESSGELVSLTQQSITNAQLKLSGIKLSTLQVIDRVKCFKQINEWLSKSTDDWLVVVRAGEEFTESGLFKLQIELPRKIGLSVLVHDEIYRQPDGTLSGGFRPSGSLDYLLSFPAGMSHHWLFNRKSLLEIGGFNTELSEAFELDAILRLISKNGLECIGHVPEPLVIAPPPILANVDDERKAIEQHLHERGYPQAEVHAPNPGRYQIRYNHPGQPIVSVVLAAGSNLSNLQRCVEGLLGNTHYQNFEILFIDQPNSAVDVKEWLAGLAAMQEPKLRVLSSMQQALSQQYNEIQNHAIGDYLLFLSADTAILSEHWLEEMLNHAQRGEVGVVGAKLLTPGGEIAHAGYILGLEGPVGSPFVGEPMDAPGYMHRLQVDQNLSAVGGDCLMVLRELFVQLDGFANGALADDYLSTDLCLRARQAGFLIVWTPHAQLMLDKPKATRPSAEQEDVMYEKWLPQLARDPAYNPNFSLSMPGGFKLADTQISWRPLDSIRPAPVALVHPADLAGCGHYRVMQPFLAMKSEGLLDGAISTGLMHVTDLERYNPDCIVLQRQIGDARLEAMQRMQKFSRAVKVYELDDYLPNLPLKSVHRKDMPKDILRSLRRGLSFVDRFVVSTHALAEAFSGLHGEIVVRENRLPLSWWGGLQTERRQGKKPRVGWAGGSSHTGDLELIADVVRDLADEVEWVFFGMCPEALKPYVHEFHGGVAIEQYPAKLASLNLDLGLAPLEHNLFNECKSNLRQLEYGACGIPIICTDIRPYQDGLQAGLPVTLVKNRYKDWVDAIRMHINDLDATAKMADELQAKVHAEWMLQGKHLEEWRDAWLGK